MRPECDGCPDFTFEKHGEVAVRSFADGSALIFTEFKSTLNYPGVACDSLQIHEGWETERSTAPAVHFEQDGRYRVAYADTAVNVRVNEHLSGSGCSPPLDTVRFMLESFAKLPIEDRASSDGVTHVFGTRRRATTCEPVGTCTERWSVRWNLSRVARRRAPPGGGPGGRGPGGGGSTPSGPSPSACANSLVGTDGPDRLTGTGASDRISGLAGDDLVDGARGGDCLYGDAGNDMEFGRSGPDLLVGGDGLDRLVAGPGDDLVVALDGVAETVFCGSGIDTAIADRADQLRSCERRL
jgi:hypothetical protein